MRAEVYTDSILRESWDDDSRTYTSYDEAGEVVSSRPYTEGENAAADAAIAADAEQAEQVKLAADTEAVVRAMVATAQPPADGQAWTQPTSAQDAYPLGATVTHGGKTWISLVAFNVWEPGDTSNPVHFTLWREVGVEPSDEWDPNGHPYAVGDEVIFEGARYRCVQAHTSQPGWTPTAVPALWTPVTG